MEVMLPAGQAGVAQRLRDHAARSRARVAGGFYCEAMDRKIVSGPVPRRTVASLLRAAPAGESNRTVGSGL